MMQTSCTGTSTQFLYRTPSIVDIQAESVYVLADWTAFRMTEAENACRSLSWNAESTSQSDIA